MQENTTISQTVLCLLLIPNHSFLGLKDPETFGGSMPFIRVTRTCDKVVIDINTASILQFYPASGNTRIDLQDNISHDIVDEPRQLRGYIKKAEGTLPEKAEPNGEQSLA